ncbi:hypothetical protein ILYODFUR_008246 [Ilyodon furcidens]|uniref:Uncharacterized protein n=1 Tax=Ilyodon furcidens TaxID=33524 RepID=A0ABV0VCK7_9TELE
MFYQAYDVFKVMCCILPVFESHKLKYFSHLVADPASTCLHVCKLDSLWVSFNNGFLFLSLFWEDHILPIDSPTRAVDLGCSSRFTMDLFAAFLNTVLVQFVILDGLPCLGRFAVVPLSFYFQMMD